MKSRVEISVIIPHFNSVDGVMRLISTIPENDELETIIVDDRSTVDIKILERLVEERKNTYLYFNNRQNKGAGTARNIGIEKAAGTWILFADADDCFDVDWVKAVFRYVNSDADMVYFPPTSFNILTHMVGARHRHYEKLVQAFAVKQDRRSEIELRYGFYTPWSKMIRRSLFVKNNIHFDEILVANDVMAMTKCAYYSKSIKADLRTIYCVTCGDNTLTSKKNKTNFDIRIDTKIRRYIFLRDRLSKKDFYQTHADYYMAGSLADAVLGKWPKGTLREVLRKYHDNNVKWLTIYMFEPRFLWHYIWLDFKWRREMNGR